MALELKKRRFTLKEYYRMAEAGILGEDDRVELIDGEIVEMTPIGARNAACVDRLTDLFTEALRGSALVRVQNPIRLSKKTEPQPDLALLRWKLDFYASGHPMPRDVFLLVEVCETSNEPDCRVKIPIYARAGILEVWLMDLQQKTITTYQDPTAASYRAVRVYWRGEQIAPSAFSDRSLAVSDVLLQ